MKLKILLADDHKLMREGIKTILDKEFEMEVIDEAENGRQAVSLAEKKKPDIVIMDIGMPELNGIEASQQILKANPDIRIIALSMHSDKQYILRIFKAGAWGYLLKDCAAEELVEAIRTVVNKRRYLSKDISDIIVQDFITADNKGQDNTLESLTDREREVLQMLAEGKSNKDIAEILFVSIKTIESHRKNIMDKLQIFTLPELTKYAIKTGLTSLD